MREVGTHPGPHLGRETVDKILDGTLTVITLVPFKGPGHISYIISDMEAQALMRAHDKTARPWAHGGAARPGPRGLKLQPSRLP